MLLIAPRSNCINCAAASNSIPRDANMGSDRFRSGLRAGSFGGKSPPSEYITPCEFRRALGAMLTLSKWAETWRALLEPRCRQKVIERWLATCSLPDGQQQYLHTVLREVEEVIRRTFEKSAAPSPNRGSGARWIRQYGVHRKITVAPPLPGVRYEEPEAANAQR